MLQEEKALLNLIDVSVKRILERDSCSIAMLCVELNVSRSHLHRQLKALTGMSTSIYLRKAKLARAEKLLKSTKLNMSEVAYKSGFASPSELSRYFVSETGVPPSRFRKSVQLGSRAGALDSKLGHVPSDLIELDVERSIAILPFRNRSQTTDENYLVDGISAEILHLLSTVKGLKVAGRHSTFSFRDSDTSVVEISRILKVKYLLCGSVQIKGKRVKLHVELLEGKKGFQVWAQRFECFLEDLFKVQDEIAKEVISRLAISVFGDSKPNANVARKTDNIFSYELYLKGKGEFELRKDLDLALSYFNQARELDPSFAYAYVGIAFTLFYKCIFAGVSPTKLLPEIMSTYEVLDDLNANIPELHVIKGWIQFYFEHEPKLALLSMDKAIQMQPRLMDAYRIKAYIHIFMRHDKEALALGKIAYDLDPLGFNAWFSYADILRRARRYEEALQHFIQIREKFPSNPIVEEITGICFYYLGDKASVSELYKPPAKMPERFGFYALGRYIFHFYHGDKTLLPKLLEHLLVLRERTWIQPSIISLLYFYTGKEDLAIQFLALAKKESDFGLKYIVSDQYWNRFRGHPEVQKVLRQIKMIPLE